MAMTLLKTAQYPFDLPEAEVGPYYTLYGSGKGPSMNFIKYRLKATEGSTPSSLMVQTSVFELNNGPLKHADGSVSFALSEEECPGLFPLIHAFEKQIHNILLTRDIRDLPRDKKEFFQKKADNLIKPITTRDRVYFQPASDCVTYNWNGTDKKPNEWCAGRYQLVLRLGNIYVGQPGQNFAAYLQWKVAQIRYEAFTEEALLNQPSTFLFGDA